MGTRIVHFGPKLMYNEGVIFGVALVDSSNKKVL